MNTLDEIIDYCNEPEVVGALLLTGEWGWNVRKNCYLVVKMTFGI